MLAMERALAAQRREPRSRSATSTRTARRRRSATRRSRRRSSASSASTPPAAARGLLDEVDARPPARRGRRDRRHRDGARARITASCRRRSTTKFPTPSAGSTTCRTSRAKPDLDVAMSNGFGFGGHNTIVVFGEHGMPMAGETRRRRLRALLKLTGAADVDVGVGRAGVRARQRGQRERRRLERTARVLRRRDPRLRRLALADGRVSRRARGRADAAQGVPRQRRPRARRRRGGSASPTSSCSAPAWSAPAAAATRASWPTRSRRSSARSTWRPTWSASTRFLEQEHLVPRRPPQRRRARREDRPAGVHASAASRDAALLRARGRPAARPPLHLAGASRRRDPGRRDRAVEEGRAAERRRDGALDPAHRGIREAPTAPASNDDRPGDRARQASRPRSPRHARHAERHRNH